MTKINFKETTRILAWVVGIVAGIIGITSSFESKENTIDLSGNWEMTFKVQKSSLERFNDNNLEYKYKIFITQNGNSIEGNGEKFWENFKGTESFYNLNQKTPISISGKISNNKLTANITEKGLRRETSGHIEFETIDNHLNIIQGNFTTTAANSSGIAILEKLND
nr:hypothetical protein [uncultured Psychroserpens sp.]